MHIKRIVIRFKKKRNILKERSSDKNKVGEEVVNDLQKQITQKSPKTS